MAIELETLVEYFEDAADSSNDERCSSERARDYYDGNQLTASEVKELERRKQPATVFNRIQPKVDFLLGAETKARTDPKAYSRTPNHDSAADAATDAIRYVCDNNRFNSTAGHVFENELIEGTGGVSVEVNRQTLEIEIKKFQWDRYFRDPHSREKDFSDIRYDGIVIWMDFVEAKEKWKNKADGLDIGMQAHVDGETHEDKPTHRQWFDNNRKRVMVIQINFIQDGVWHTAVFSKGTMLEAPAVSFYVDEDGEPENPLIKVSAKVDRQGNRYGPVKGLIDIQDEINKRRSKSLHILTKNQTFSKKGMIENIRNFKAEVNKPDGHIEFPMQGEFGKDFGVIPDTGLGAAQFQMYQDSIQQMDSVSANAALGGTTDQGLSGRAVQSLQNGGMIELSPLFEGHTEFKNRVHRAIWNRIKQFWKADKWIRVTDDEENLKYVGLNQPVTLAEQMVMEKTQLSLSEVKKEFENELQQIYQLKPELGQIVEIANEVAEIDVDIIIDEVPDIINLQGEQFDQLVKMYQANPDGIPWEAIVQMSTLRNKDKILGKDDPAQQQNEQRRQAIQEEIAKVETEKTQSETNKNNATTEMTRQEGIQKQIENALILADPEATNVSI